MRIGVAAACTFLSVIGLSVAGEASASVKRHTTIIAQGLGPALQQALAGWYQAVNRPNDHERASRAVFMSMSENELARRLEFHLRPWQRQSGPLPTTLEPDVLRLLAVLFERVEDPQRYLGRLQQFYQASHDFRLLAVPADAIVGSPARRCIGWPAEIQS